MSNVEGKLAKNAKVHTIYKDNRGVRVPSVTTILGVIAKPSLIAWANRIGIEGHVYEDYMKETAKAGTLAHEMIQGIIGGPAFEPDLSMFTPDQQEAAQSSVKNFLDWKSAHDIEVYNIEMPLVSEIGFGGTIDLLAKIDGKTWLVDFKTGKGLYSEYDYQVSAYWQMLKEAGYQVDGVGILRVGRADEGYEFRNLAEVQLEKAFNVFMSAFNLYKTRQAYEKKS